MAFALLVILRIFLLVSVERNVQMAYYNCLLFDVDDTLLDFSAAERQALQETFQKFEIPYTDENVSCYQSINTSLWAALEKGEIKKDKLVVKRFEQLLQQLNLQGNPAAINEYYLNRLSEKAVLFEDADVVLKNLSEVATIAVVSNGVEKVQKGRLQRSGLLPLMDAVFVSEKLGVTKPNRKFFDMALQTLGVNNKQKVLVIGDSLKADIQGGNNAGLATCWCNFSQAENHGKIKPQYEIHHLQELYELVMEQEELDDIGNTAKRHML